MTHLKGFIVILLALVIIIFAVQNHEAMSKSVYFRFNPVVSAEVRTPELSIYQIAILSFLLGVVVAGLYGVSEGFRLRRQVRKFRRELQERERELSSLRAQPVAAEPVNPGATQAT